MFQDHLPIARLLEETRIPEEPLSTLPDSMSSVCPYPPKHKMEPGYAHVIVNLGSMQERNATRPVDLKLDGFEDTGLYSLDIKTEGGKKVYHRSLPLEYDLAADTFVFRIKELEETKVVIKVFRDEAQIDGNPRKDERVLIGAGTALVDEDCGQFSTKHGGLIREMCVPILEVGTMEGMGTIRFTYLVAKPYDGLDTPTISFEALKTAGGELTFSKVWLRMMKVMSISNSERTLLR